MSRFRLLPAALADLAEIRDYIAEHNPAAAAAMLERIEDRCRFFARFPGAGRNRADIRPGLHSFVVGRHVVFYRRGEAAIDIVRVLHRARDIEAIVG
ncbi:MAG: type II toxin-antitoxin system RelE/ParE family toxin [Candidatus Odyssella sp.]|nr:type II toxin-antitoxin system RelE/ParE family toxin [Candidatus Odyssella sp.]